MKDLTVREAFEKAGYPVPEGARLVRPFCHDCDISYWVWRTDNQYSDTMLKGIGWSVDDMPEDDESWLHEINLSNLPAKDCLDALPEVVRKVVEASE